MGRGFQSRKSEACLEALVILSWEVTIGDLYFIILGCAENGEEIAKSLFTSEDVSQCCQAL